MGPAILMSLPEMIPGSLVAIVVVLVATDALLHLAETIERWWREERQEEQRHGADDD